MTNYRFITFNGPIGSGKSWVCNQLQALYGNGNSIYENPVFRRASFQDALRESTMILLGVGPDVSYDQFKVTDYQGRTGRQWMIDIATRARENDPVVFSRTLLANVRRNYKSTDFILVDSNGFEDELDFLRSQLDVDLLACSIEPEGTAPRGELYGAGDSRFNLAHKCGQVQPNSTLMLAAVDAAMKRRGWLK